MGLYVDTVPGSSRVIRRVWSAHCDSPTDFSSVVKASSAIVFASNGGDLTVHVRGPETRATPLTCAPDWEFFGVELGLGVHLPLFPPSGTADLHDAVLPVGRGERLVLDGRSWEVPTVQDVDVFVGRLLRAGVVVLDPLVEDLRYGERPSGMSPRVAHLRFRRAVGVPRRTLVAIERARDAARVLAAGGSITDAVERGRYYDQPQLARAMRRATGHTPSQLRTGTAFLAF